MTTNKAKYYWMYAATQGKCHAHAFDNLDSAYATYVHARTIGGPDRIGYSVKALTEEKVTGVLSQDFASVTVHYHEVRG